MALPYSVQTTIADHTGKTGTTVAFVSPGATIADMNTFATNWAELLDGVIGGIIRNMQFCVQVDLTGLTGNLAADTADVEEVGEFIFLTSENRTVALNLPCINDLASGVGTDDINQAEANMAPIIDIMLNGFTTAGGQINPCDVNEDDIVSVKTARERVRNSGSRG